MAHKITRIESREILDSRGDSTIEADIYLGNNIGRASVPSGKSKGANEAIEVPSQKAVENINKIIAKKILNLSFLQKKLDNFLIKLDGTKKKSNLGANTILAISIAFAKAAAKKENIPLYKYLQKIAKNKSLLLPLPMMNIINGGKHSIDSFDIQEFMIIPQGANFKESFEIGAKIFHELKKTLESKKLSTLIGDEGGFSPPLNSNEAAIKLIKETINKTGYKSKTKIAIDAAASTFYKNKKYYLKKDDLSLTTDELINLYKKWTKEYNLLSIEDPLEENDWQGFKKITSLLGNKTRIVGDDLFCTNPSLLKKGVKIKAANSIIIKPNQIGTVSETINVANLAKKANYTFIISHRSGETEDTFISHLAVGLGAKFIKAGAPSHERISKYDELLRIEEEIKNEKP